MKCELCGKPLAVMAIKLGFTAHGPCIQAKVAKIQTAKR